MSREKRCSRRKGARRGHRVPSFCPRFAGDGRPRGFGFGAALRLGKLRQRGARSRPDRRTRSGDASRTRCPLRDRESELATPRGDARGHSLRRSRGGRRGSRARTAGSRRSRGTAPVHRGSSPRPRRGVCPRTRTTRRVPFDAGRRLDNSKPCERLGVQSVRGPGVCQSESVRAKLPDPSVLDEGPRRGATLLPLTGRRTGPTRSCDPPRAKSVSTAQSSVRTDAGAANPLRISR